MRSKRAAVLLFGSLLCLAACHPPPPDPLEGLPPLDGLEIDPAKTPVAPAEQPTWVSASHLLVAWRGAEGAYHRVRLDRDGARLRVERLAQLARSKGQDFSDLAKRFSDDSETSLRGGTLGLFVRGERHPDLEAAAFSIGPGQVAGPVETPQGFHLLYRDPEPWAQAQEIVISFQGALRYRPRLPRTRDEARQLAQDIHRRLGQGESFAVLARKFSDLGNFERGGIYSIFRRGSQHPDFEKVVFALQPGELSEVIETPTGFHIVRRLPIEKVQLRQLQLDYGGRLLPGDPKPIRDRDQAKRLAAEIRSELEAGKDFAALVSRWSDSSDRSPRWYARGELPFTLDLISFSLKPGEVSLPIDTGNNLVLLKRVK